MVEEDDEERDRRVVLALTGVSASLDMGSEPKGRMKGGRGASTGEGTGDHGTHRVNIDDVSLEVRDGDFLGLVLKPGRRRDLLFSVLGLIETPDSGSVTLNSMDVSGLPEKKRSDLRLRHLGIVFKKNYFMEDMSIRENITIFLQECSKPKNEIDRLTLEALERVGLEKRGNFKPVDLSKFELKAADLARAIAKDPDILLVNEPPQEANPDGLTIVDLLRDLHRRLGFTVVFVTTDRSLGERADRCLEPLG